MRDGRVLVIDDEPAISRALRPTLQGQGYEVATAFSGVEGLSQLEKFAPSLILLDLGLPDVDGVVLTGQLREQTDVPIIVLSVRDSERDKVAALDNGANDYVTKPFSMGELLARMRAATRHYRPASSEGVEPAQQQISAGEIVLDPARHSVTLRGMPVHLSPTEFNLLELLMQNAGKLVTHRTLLHKVWGPQYTGDTQLLRVYIGQLRAKIESQPDRPAYILTEPGVGYRFSDP